MNDPLTQLLMYGRMQSQRILSADPHPLFAKSNVSDYDKHVENVFDDYIKQHKGNNPDKTPTEDINSENKHVAKRYNIPDAIVQYTFNTDNGDPQDEISTADSSIERDPRQSASRENVEEIDFEDPVEENREDTQTTKTRGGRNRKKAHKGKQDLDAVIE